MNVPKGTPVTMATVNPVNMMEMAEALLLGGTKAAAMVDPMEKKTPWAQPVTIRAITKVAKLGATEASPFPTMNNNIK